MFCKSGGDSEGQNHYVHQKHSLRNRSIGGRWLARLKQKLWERGPSVIESMKTLHYGRVPGVTCRGAELGG